MKNLLFLLTVILLMSGCNRGKESSIPAINILESPDAEMKNISEIGTDIRYIPLETTAKNAMRFIREIRFVNQKFYVYAIAEILCFDKNGKYLYKLSRQGKGPEEYLYLSDFDLIPEKKQLVVLTGDKLQYYAETDTGFQFVKTVNLTDRAQAINFLPGSEDMLVNYNLSLGTSKKMAAIVSPELDTLARFPNRYAFTKVNPKIVMAFNYEHLILINNGKLKYKSIFNDTVFELDKKLRFIPELVINTEGKQMTKEFLEGVMDMEAAGMSYKYVQVTDMKMIGELYFIKYNYEKAPQLRLYDPENNKMYSIDPKTFLIDDISGGVGIDPKSEIDGVLYSWTEAMTLKTRVAGDDFKNSTVLDPERKSELMKLAEKLTETDNQVLIAVTLK